MLHRVPVHILQRVKAHLACLHEFNAAIVRWRAIEQRLGGAGRYEFEYRLARETEVQQSQQWLDTFATLAQKNGIDPAAVFAALGGRPLLEPWSSAAQAWRQDNHERGETG
jgi:hypothetical protein